MDVLSEVLDLEPIVSRPVKQEVLLPIEPDHSNLPTPLSSNEQQEEQDFQLARAKIQLVLTKSADAFDDILQLARDSEHPRAYEVVADFTRAVAEVGEKLTNMHDKRRQKKEDSGKTITNNNVFVGSTAELLAMMKGKKSATNADE